MDWVMAMQAEDLRIREALFQSGELGRGYVRLAVRRQAKALVNLG
jgi:hypothetical protein